MAEEPEEVGFVANWCLLAGGDVLHEPDDLAALQRVGGESEDERDEHTGPYEGAAFATLPAGPWIRMAVRD